MGLVIMPMTVDNADLVMEISKGYLTTADVDIIPGWLAKGRLAK